MMTIFTTNCFFSPRKWINITVLSKTQNHKKILKKIHNWFQYSFIINIHIFSVNKQINDKERVAAALENPNLSQVVEKCLVEKDY